MCSTFLAMRYGKKAVAIVGFTLTTVFMAAVHPAAARRDLGAVPVWSSRAR